MTRCNIMRVAPLFIFLLQGVWLLSPQARGQEASVLATGNWYKFAIVEDGIYRLTGSDLSALGVDVSSFDAETIRMFGQGGGMLPQPLSEPRLTDLPEIAIWVEDGGDGRLDAQDYLLFYGQSPHDLHFEANSQGEYQATYQKNLYSDTAYYFLTVGGSAGKRIQPAVAVENPVWETTYYQEAIVHEEELENVLQSNLSSGSGSGREWYGEDLSGSNLQLDIGVNDWRDEKPLLVHTRVVGRSQNSSEVQLSMNNTAIGKITLDAILSGTYTQKGKVHATTFSVDAGVGRSAANTLVTFSLSGSGAKANLDQLMVEGARPLIIPPGRSLRWRNLESVDQATTRFKLSSASQPVVWDVTSPLQPKQVVVSSFDNQWAISTQTSGQLIEFVTAGEGGWSAPEFISQVANQNLKGAGVPNLLIITRDDLVPEAERLAEFRRTYNQLDVLVATNQQIYNEFSSGAQDVTALRNFIKYLYDREPGQLQSVLLLGKGSYDYKNYTTNNINVVPIYESRNSLHPIYSYSSDDYFGLLEDNEGEWEETFAGDETLDIGVGRLPVKNREEAKTVVDKLIHYQTSEATFGQWRNQVVFVADDGDNDKHQRDAEQLSKLVDTSYSSYSISKIYLDAFPQQRFPGREEAPAVNQQIEDAIKKGALIINFTGHGSEATWTDERVLTTGMINRFRNKDQLPFIVTATCDFGRHDDPQQVSGAEHLILNPQGGAIGLVATGRPVFSNSNFLLNRAFYDEVFRRENGQPLTLGEVFRRTKNNGLNGPVNRNFSLLGDPSMTLAYPQDQVQINQLAVRQADGQFVETDTLRALDHVRVSGSIVIPGTQQLAVDFSGKVAIEVLDKPTFQRTQGNEGTFMQFEERNSVIHRGNARVSNGQFTLDFVIPKNIVYQTGQGKISAYAEATRSNTANRDANGAFVTFEIGGSRSPLAAEDIPPSIQLFMDDTTFVNGGLTGVNSLLLAHLQDEHGVSISPSSLGQNITAELIYGETGESRTFVLNDFYQTDVDRFQSGWIRYPLENLEEGSYQLTLRAWDTYNNEGIAQLAFQVGDEGSLWVADFYNYPNPFSEETQFVLDHNHPGKDLDITVRIYDNQGNILHSMQTTQQESATRLNSLTWDGRNTDGARLPSGIYFANVTVQVPELGIVQQKTHQIIIAH
uniref:Type IX secretion system sortase PorU n=1 Tax=Roseihalotalea indica TaxID=2867963 RepID=A0AA49JG92_9BACT|nr:type IX secretion system sortase PorU [Tunicatimonas sp. TK19036]